MRINQKKNRPVKYAPVVVLLGSLSIVSTVYAAPQGGQVVGGSGSISQSNLTTNIQQNTQNLAIDWQSYNLNSNEKVNYLQPNSSSIALNRVLGGSASQIFGQINANGQVVLVNPNGILL
jgi:filamentous hemagglutinin family protein